MSERQDDGSICPESIDGKHCLHFYFEDADHGDCTDKGRHCCYCDRVPEQAVLDGADPEPTITREWLDGLIEQVLKARYPGSYDCDDRQDDCQEWIRDDREELYELRDAIIAALSKEQT